MNCEDVMLLLSSHIDGETTEAEEAQLQAHLADCADCRALLAALQGIHENTAALAVPAPEGLQRGIMYRIGQEAGTVKKAKRRFFGPGTGVGLAAAVLVLLVGTGLIKVPERSLEKKSDEKAAYSDDAAPAEAAGQKDEPLPELANGELSWDWMEDSKVLSSYGATAADSGAAGSLQAETSSVELAPWEAEPDAPAAAQETDKRGVPTQNAAPEEPLPTDNYYVDGKSGSGGTERNQIRVLEEELILSTQALSVEKDAPVLLYTEFDSRSLLALLEAEVPALYERLKELTPESMEDGALCWTADYETVLAIHEWLLQNLPHSEQMSDQALEDEISQMLRIEELDPGSGCLNAVVTWTPRAKPVEWPESWPEGWALRLRSGENWGLFFPAEDAHPKGEDEAYLILFPPANE